MTTAEKALQEDIAAGAWVTPGGDPVVTVIHSNVGPCVYCGETIHGYTVRTKGGMTQAMPGTCQVLRWFNGRFEKWHPDCLEAAQFYDWVMNANRTVHIAGCRYAHADEKNEQTFHGMRGEARHAFDYVRFCRHCAPLSKWIDQ